ncbi:hypothetical protein A8M56_08325 [Yersinia pestis]|nr:hypothetical protein A8M56_08325 [Yersinia pestis]
MNIVITAGVKNIDCTITVILVLPLIFVLLAITIGEVNTAINQVAIYMHCIRCIRLISLFIN